MDAQSARIVTNAYRDSSVAHEYIESQSDLLLERIYKEIYEAATSGEDHVRLSDEFMKLEHNYIDNKIACNVIKKLESQQYKVVPRGNFLIKW